MKNWDTLEPDLYQLMNVHYTPGRGGHSIRFIVRHHNAGVNLTTESCWQLWQRREASCHYQVEASGRIGQLVNDWDTAWHAADLLRNQESIGIEHANIGGPEADWPISTATIDAGAHLAAALCTAYNLGRPEFGHNIRDHKETGQTACPYHLAAGGKYHQQWMDRATYWYDRMTHPDSTPPQPAVKDIEMTPDQEALLRDNNALLRVIAAQLCGDANNFGGWEQGGGRTLYDLAAATASQSGVPGTRDTKAGEQP